MDIQMQYCQDILCNLIYRFNSNQNHSKLLCGYWQIDCKYFLWRHQRPESQIQYWRRTKMKDWLSPTSRLNNKTTVTKTVQYLWKNRQTNQWKRIENQDIDPPKYTRWSQRKQRSQDNGQKIVFSTMEQLIICIQKHRPRHKLTAFANINSKWVIVKPWCDDVGIWA